MSTPWYNIYDASISNPLGKPFVTVSPGPCCTGSTPSGADFGSDSLQTNPAPGNNGSSGTKTSTFGIQEALNYASNNGSIAVVLLPGTFSPAGGVTIPSNATIVFGGCTFNQPAGVHAFSSVSTSNILIAGSVSYVGNKSSYYFISIGPVNNFEMKADVSLSSVKSGQAAINVYHGSDVRFTGHVTTADSAYLYTNAVSQLKVQNFSATYSANPGIVPIFITGNDASATDISVSDIYIDGGTFLMNTGVVIGPNSGYTFSRLHLTRITVKNMNTTSNGDGVDLIRVYDAVATDLEFNSTNNGISVAWCFQVVVSGVSCRSCRAPGIEIGDAGSLNNTMDIVVSDFVCVDCGTGNTGAASSGVYILAPSGYVTQSVVIRNGICDYTQSLTLYGLGLSGSGVSEVVVEGVTLNGFNAPLLASSLGNNAYGVRNCPNYNPRGFNNVTTPAIAAGTKFTNTYPFPVRVIMWGGSNINSIQIWSGNGSSWTGTAGAFGGEITLDPGGAIEIWLNTGGTLPQWAWCGV